MKTRILITVLVVSICTGSAWAQALLGAGRQPPVRKNQPASNKAKPAPRRPSQAKPNKTTRPAKTTKAVKPTTTQPVEAVAARPIPAGMPEGLAVKLYWDVAWQSALDIAGFSPGVIDGVPGTKTGAGTKTFQERQGLAVTGILDDATRQAMGLDARPALRQYTITQADLEAVGPNPKRWQEKAKLAYLGYQSLLHLAAERGHCSRLLVGRLNPDKNVEKLKVGDVLWLPNIETAAATASAPSDTIEIDFDHKIIRVLDPKGEATALFHCSIAAKKEKRPQGACRVASVTLDPRYLFDPKMWPEVKDVKQKLYIPPGPRNPVGVCWIGLSHKGYGIHGTPEPEMIGKSGSHGCFRMTNWDVTRLSGMIQVGTQVKLVEGRAVAAGKAPR